MQCMSPSDAGRGSSVTPADARLVIIGVGQWAVVAYECFTYDSPYDVIAFSAEARHLSTATYCGLPVVALEDMTRNYPPERCAAFVAVAPPQHYRTRKLRYDAVKSAGYTCASYVSSRAFAARNVQVGENTFVREYAALQHMARIGNNVIVGNGTCVGHSAVIEDDCFIGQHVVIAGFTRIGRGSMLGANSCIVDVINVAGECTISPGAVVFQDTKFGQVYIGNPARPVSCDPS
jgi:sugar O-acyltransferase (sialic acid O-acetyltransferase NeuD family)